MTAVSFLSELTSAADAGDVPRALALCNERLASSPEDADAHRHLGRIQAALGERVLALRHARRACELAPDDARVWSDFGSVLGMDGQFADAARCFQEAIAIDPQHANAWHNLGMAFDKLGDRQGAFDALKRTLQLDDSRAATYLVLGNLLIEAGQLDDAVECFERAAARDPRLAKARSRLARELSTRGKVKRAESLYRQSLALDPQHIEGWLGLGRTLEDLGEADGALGCYRHVLARQPEHAFALGQYLALVRGAPDTAIVSRASSALDDARVIDEAKALIGYGLAKYHDRRRDYAAAAHAGSAANSARRRHTGVLDRAQLTARIDRLIDTYTRDFFREHRRYGIGDDQPVFIVGLPRSGTTLTEQIIASHPELHGAGELPDLARLAVSCMSEDLAHSPVPRLDEMQSRVLAHEYLHALRDGAPRPRARISDKSPLNFFNLGFACLLLPNARVIHCHRDARDNALSIWMENFNAESRYATDFSDLAFFRAQYERLMQHWREHLPLSILDVRYEDTVDDLESQARRVLGFLGVSWDARCLEFHRHERAVQTPSRWQVREPVYRRSVERWRTYATYLPELPTAFDDAPPTSLTRAS
jgi:tetratricopeptide (TPR) repeat protein